MKRILIFSMNEIYFVLNYELYYNEKKKIFDPLYEVKPNLIISIGKNCEEN